MEAFLDDEVQFLLVTAEVSVGSTQRDQNGDDQGCAHEDTE